MALRIRINILAGKKLLVGKPFEDRDHAPRRLTGGVEIGQGGAIGDNLLVAAVGEEGALRQARTNGGRGRPGAGAGGGAGGGAGDHRRAAENAGDRPDHAGARDLVAQVLQMPAREVAGLVGDDADELVGVAGGQHGASVDHHAPAARHEGVEFAVLEDDYLGAARADAGRPEHRFRVVAQERFDLCVADGGLAGPLRRSGGGREARRQHQRDDGAERTPPGLACLLNAEQESRHIHRFQRHRTSHSVRNTASIALGTNAAAREIKKGSEC